MERSDSKKFENSFILDFSLKRKLEEIPYGFNVTINLEKTKIVDNSVMENLDHLIQDICMIVMKGNEYLHNLEDEIESLKHRLEIVDKKVS